MGWWSENIFKLKEAWLSSDGKWTDTECRIIERRELSRQRLLERLRSQPPQNLAPWERDELYESK